MYTYAAVRKKSGTGLRGGWWGEGETTVMIVSSTNLRSRITRPQCPDLTQPDPVTAGGHVILLEEQEVLPANHQLIARFRAVCRVRRVGRSLIVNGGCSVTGAR